MPFEYHENQVPLEEGAILWRYMDLEKYFSLLENQSLFFCRADKFSDPFEGSLPKKEADHRLNEEKFWAEHYNEEFDEVKALSNIKARSEWHKKFKRGIIVNCWHINNNESDAMWRLYLKDNEGVAIQTNYTRMQSAINAMGENVGMSKVRYLDYESQIWYHEKEYPHLNANFLVPLFHKRKEFIHEREFRLYHQIQEAIDDTNYWDDKPNHKGRMMKVDLNILIEKIILPPTIDDKSKQKIKNFTASMGFNFQFEQSKLNDHPIY